MAIRGKGIIQQTLGRSLTSEEKALILLSGPERINQQEIRKFLASSDHQGFKSLVLRHKLVSNIYKNTHFPIEDMPHRFRQTLKTPANNTTRRMLMLGNEMVQLNQAFNENGLYPVFLKGPALGLQLFHDVGKRYSVDIDVLIQKKALPFVHDVLLSLNYQPQKTPVGKNRLSQKIFSYAKKDWTYIKSHPRIPLELHYRLFPNNTYESREKNFIHNGTEELRFANASVLVLKPVQHFLFLAAHGSVHQWFQLFWLKDIAEFIHQQKIQNWDEVIQLAQGVGLKRTLILAAHLSHVIYGTELPNEFINLVQSRSQKYLLKESIKTIFNPIHESMSRRLQRMWYLSRLDSTVRYKINTLLGGLGRYVLEG